MLIKYTEHLEIRLHLRNTEHTLPKVIFEDAKERYSDGQTGHFVAIMKVMLY